MILWTESSESDSWNSRKRDVVSQHFAPKLMIGDSELVPSLVYCHTQNDTYLALKAINSARQNKNNSYNGLSSSVQRYHASTCPTDKARRSEDFGNAKFSTMTCTNALGLGQNWTRVRRVIIMGQLDPMKVLQMTGRGGRDGRPSVAFLIANPPSKTDMESLMVLPHQTQQDNDHNMHAMSMTEVCLRVAFAILLRCGYVPLSKTDQPVLNETQRQADAGMAPCLCSNCNSNAAKFFLHQQKTLTASNFTELVLQKNVPENQPDFILEPDTCDTNDASPRLRPLGPQIPERRILHSGRPILTHKALDCVLQLQFYLGGVELDDIFGSEPLPNTYESILQDIRMWKGSTDVFAVLHPTGDKMQLYNEAKAAIKIKNVKDANDKENVGQASTSTSAVSTTFSVQSTGTKQKPPTNLGKKGKSAKRTVS
ncbi:hypothetical protein DFH28DRAFT_1137505 [Melampsora americana]|nr:hypothetical protein DFH28DRAFT_1137505 [Melampsora americana]